MKKTYKLLIILISLAVFSSCQKDKSIIETELNQLKINSDDFIKIDTSFNEKKAIEKLRFVKSDKEDIRVFFYESGKKKSIIPVKNSQVHGECIDWYENGKTKWKREYDYGNFVGLNEEFDSLGIISNRIKYTSNGEEYTIFFQKGEPAEFTSDSIQISYYLNNNIMSKFNKSNDSLSSIKFYNENGSLVLEGELDSEFRLLKNKKPFTGEVIGKFTSNDTAYYFNRINGEMNGRAFFKYGNGQLQSEMYFENGKRKGIHESYYLNGNPRSYNDYENSINKYWDENGDEF
jgi:antitoxin component YwqK of YwqJK toxin-antitoxin module